MEGEILEQIEQLFDYSDKDVDEFCEKYVGEEAVFSFAWDWLRIFIFVQLK